MTLVETSVVTEAYRNRCEDFVATLVSEERTVIVVADGAGGIGSGRIAAETVVREVELASPHMRSADHWSETLQQIDCCIPSGESTAVVVDIRPYGIAGASVGDSEAWIINGERVVDLTKGQTRKPLLGSGNAKPVSFTHGKLDGLLVVATDGFCSYARRDDLTVLIATTNFHTIARKCVEMVRLPSGELWDDIGIAIARLKPISRVRSRYSI